MSQVYLETVLQLTGYRPRLLGVKAKRPTPSPSSTATGAGAITGGGGQSASIAAAADDPDAAIDDEADEEGEAATASASASSLGKLISRERACCAIGGCLVETQDRSSNKYHEVSHTILLPHKPHNAPSPPPAHTPTHAPTHPGTPFSHPSSRRHPRPRSPRVAQARAGHRAGRLPHPRHRRGERSVPVAVRPFKWSGVRCGA